MGQIQTGRMPISSRQNASNSGARAIGMSTSCMTDSGYFPLIREKARVKPHLLFQRITFAYVVELRRSRPMSLRTRGFCANRFFEHQNQSVSQRQMKSFADSQSVFFSRIER